MAFTVKITGTTSSCGECPHREYYSAGVYECTKTGANLPHGQSHAIPDWCPLPDHPAQTIEALRHRIAQEGAATQ
ncbi:hypothetical protein ACVIGB_000544 [Bradyrhizobium sp. USDA 4341]